MAQHSSHNSACVISMMALRHATHQSCYRFRRSYLCGARTGEGEDTPYREIYADPTFGWGAVAQELAVVDVDGGHITMLQDSFVDSLAEALMPYLQQEAGSIRSSPLELA